MIKENRTWLVFANKKRCRHADAIRELGFINWVMGKKFHFSIGDIVYMFMSDERLIRFKTVVTAEDCDREDKKYWIKDAPDDKTYKLEFVKEYNGTLLGETELEKHGFAGGKSIENPCCNNKALFEYINSVFDAQTPIDTLQRNITHRPMLIVDLNSGSYLNNQKGHETLNLDRNIVDGRFYGYCPPHDRINITRLGAGKSDESISGVTVVYTAKQKYSSDREIIAFCLNATIHREGRNDKRLKRIIEDNGKRVYCSYSIESDSLINLTTVEPKFVIHTKDYNAYMFRMQRVFKDTYPQLDKRIQDYISDYLNAKDRDDDFSYQEKIQNEEDSGVGDSGDASTTEPQYLTGSDCQAVKKNPKIAKQSLANSEYKCTMDAHHITFITSKGTPYMEGHHLIPCTYSNAKYFWDTYGRNIDCANNIICLCPTCHRKIHYASDREKRIMVEQVYEKHKNKLHSAGLTISLPELLKLYNI